MKGYVRIALLVTTIGLCWNTVVRADEFSENSYVNSVIIMLNIHADAIQQLNAGPHIKYSNNLVRHASALEQTFGLLGPMDWHAAESFTLMSNKNPANQQEDQDRFEQLEKRSSLALKSVVLAAHYALEEGNREGLTEALESMKKSCNDCHTYLPTSVAPDVWGDLKRK